MLPGALRKTIVIACGLWAFACASATAVEPSAEDLRALAAEADEAREERRRVEAAWDEEAAQLRLLLNALQDQRARVAADNEQVNAAISAIKQESDKLRAAGSSLTAVHDQTKALIDEITQSLKQSVAASNLHFSQQSAADENGLAFSLSKQLSLALARLAELEEQTRAIEQFELSGLLPDGSRRAATVLSLGGSAAWWKQGTDVGGVLVADGVVYFYPVINPSEVAAILAAFASHDGSGPAEAQLLPLPPPMLPPPAVSEGGPEGEGAP